VRVDFQAQQHLLAIHITQVKIEQNQVGQAAYPSDSTNKDTLLRLADGRMYEAKALGLSIVTASTVRAN
jgi:GGDEF domain-containing protein